jgi:hypothetical protein
MYKGIVEVLIKSDLSLLNSLIPQLFFFLTTSTTTLLLYYYHLLGSADYHVTYSPPINKLRRINSVPTSSGHGVVRPSNEA